MQPIASTVARPHATFTCDKTTLTYVRQDYIHYPNLRYALLLMSWYQFSREHGIKLPHVKLH